MGISGRGRRIPPLRRRWTSEETSPPRSEYDGVYHILPGRWIGVCWSLTERTGRETNVLWTAWYTIRKETPTKTEHGVVFSLVVWSRRQMGRFDTDTRDDRHLDSERRYDSDQDFGAVSSAQLSRRRIYCRWRERYRTAWAVFASVSDRFSFYIYIHGPREDA